MSYVHAPQGILYINPGDLGWNPYVTSWVETRESQAEKASLTILGGHSMLY